MIALIDAWASSGCGIFYELDEMPVSLQT